jgi:hypothetical protein
VRGKLTGAPVGPLDQSPKIGARSSDPSTFPASQRCPKGHTLFVAIQRVDSFTVAHTNPSSRTWELLGHSWVATTMRYVHVHRTRIEDAWVDGQQRAAQRLKGLI